MDLYEFGLNLVNSEKWAGFELDQKNVLERIYFFDKKIRIISFENEFKICFFLFCHDTIRVDSFWIRWFE